jgi:hypothetical protein
MNDATSRQGTQTSDAPESVHPRARYKGAFRISLAISAVLHLLAISIYPSFFSGIPEAERTFGDYTQPLRPQGTELVNLRELPADQEPDSPTEPEERPEVDPLDLPSVRLPPGVDESRETDASTEAGAGLSAAERLRPRGEDLRFWAPIDPEVTAPSDEEIMRLRLAARLELLNDSAAAAAAEAADALDWTYTDEDGKKWGISPGQLHLGGVTVPLPSFGTSPGQSEWARDRLWAWDEIQRGEAAGMMRQSWRDRDRAIRERMNAERKPDTTRTGGGGGER